MAEEEIQLIMTMRPNDTSVIFFFSKEKIGNFLFKK